MRLARTQGTVTSLTDPSGRELLFVSQEAVYNGKKAIRGGIPLVFPVFGAGPCDGCEALPSHGFGRTSEWQVASADRRRVVHGREHGNNARGMLRRAG